jgi:hypothetical protein
MIDALTRHHMRLLAAAGGAETDLPGQEFHRRNLRDAETFAAWRARIHCGVKANFNPSQPRAPRGSADGGQWTDTGGGAGPRAKPSARPAAAKPGSPFGSPRPRARQPEAIDPATGKPLWVLREEEGLGHPVSPFELAPIGAGGRAAAAGAVKLTEKLGALGAKDALVAAEIMAARNADEAMETALRAADPEKVAQGFKALGEFFGGKIPSIRIFKEGGDTVLIEGDLMVRFDISKFGRTPGSRPHFQIQKRVSLSGERPERWKDVGEHWYNFKDSEVFIKK